jgi:hypothetical protein
MERRIRSASRGAGPYSSLADLLPNVRYSSQGGEPKPITNAVVAGKITDVTKGRGMFWRQDGSGDPTFVAFDDERAVAKVIHFTLQIERSLDSTSNPGGRVRVGLAVGGGAEFRKLEVGLKSLGSVLLFLYRGSPILAYDSDLFAIVEDGAFLATVDPAGALDLPFIDSTRKATLLLGAGSIAALETAYAKETRVVSV